MNGMAFLNELAQSMQFHLEVRETVTPGKAPQSKCVHSDSVPWPLQLFRVRKKPHDNLTIVSQIVLIQVFQYYSDSDYTFTTSADN